VIYEVTDACWTSRHARGEGSGHRRDAVTRAGARRGTGPGRAGGLGRADRPPAGEAGVPWRAAVRVLRPGVHRMYRSRFVRRAAGGSSQRSLHQVR
jgi:hypothetical protein